MVQQDEGEEGLPSQLRHIQERIRVLEDEEVELISVPVPDFSDSDPADIVHDFHRVRSLPVSRQSWRRIITSQRT